MTDSYPESESFAQNTLMKETLPKNASQSVIRPESVTEVGTEGAADDYARLVEERGQELDDTLAALPGASGARPAGDVPDEVPAGDEDDVDSLMARARELEEQERREREGGS